MVNFCDFVAVFVPIDDGFVHMLRKRGVRNDHGVFLFGNTLVKKNADCGENEDDKKSEKDFQNFEKR